MMNVYEENVNYLRELCDDEELNQVMESAKFPDAFIYNYYEVVDDFNIMSCELYDEVYSDMLENTVLIYKIQHLCPDMAFLVQVFDVPDVPNCFETRFVMFISEEMVEDKVFYKHVVGHEIAHLDFYHLPEFNEHEYQERYPFIETYCDLKSIESIDNETDKYYILQRMMETMKDGDDYLSDEIDIEREYEIRSKFMRLAIKGKMTSKMVANYINRNYVKHMEYLSKLAEEFSEFEEKRFKSIDLSFEAFCYQNRIERRLLRKYYI